MKRSKENKPKKLWWQKLLIFLGILLGVVAVFLLAVRLYFRLPVQSYYSASETTFEIPGIGDGFVAQGLAYENGKFYATGYMNDGSASPIYIIDEATGKLEKTIYMHTDTGEAFTAHCGGLDLNGDYIYVAYEAGVAVFQKSNLENAASGSSVSYSGLFQTATSKDQDYVGVACVTIKDGKLILGEFYRDESYPTPDNHKLTTPAGDYNQALAIVFALSDAEGSVYGINPEPLCLYSLPDQVQGMAVENNKFYCSTSWGTSSSHIFEYDLSKASEGTKDFMGYTLPIYYLDSASLTYDYKIAPMSEEIVFRNGKMYTMCESASNKYIFGKFTSAKWCYATDLNKMK